MTNKRTTVRADCQEHQMNHGIALSVHIDCRDESGLAVRISAAARKAIQKHFFKGTR